MNEDHFREIEKVLLYVSEARKRAATVADAIAMEPSRTSWRRSTLPSRSWPTFTGG